MLLNKKINELNKILLKQSIDYDIKPINIYLHINSFGGSLFAAFSTIDTIINSQIPIISIVEGAAASAATLISIVSVGAGCLAGTDISIFFVVFWKIESLIIFQIRFLHQNIGRHLD